MKYKFLPAAIAALLSTHAFADTSEVELPSMVVSADFRPNTAQETPISLTTIDSETIESRGAQHIEDILNL
ncbi:MAG: TonB-dependent receptor, partial [Pseudomonadota bacterium]|nr:TonB-dependent receptor [Pseudomonadota bacterium]